MKAYITAYHKINSRDISSEYQALALHYPKFFKMDTFCKLGYLAAAHIFQNQAIDPQTALIIGTRSSSLATDIAFQASLNRGNYFPSPSLFVYTLPNIVLGEISLAFNIYGENTCFVAEKIEDFDLKSIIDLLFSQTTTKQILCGWIEDGKEEQCASLLLLSKENNTHEFSNNKLYKLHYHGRID